MVMRGIVRKALNVDSIFWIIALSAFVLVIYILFALPDASAVTRAEYDMLKEQERTAQNKIYDLEKQLTAQRELINAQTITVENLKQDLRKLDGDGTWESLRLKIEGESLIKIGRAHV